MRRSSIFWGLMLILAGGLLILDNLDIIQVDAWDIIWPSFLIALGISTLWGSLFRSSKNGERANVPLEGARQAEVILEHGGGRLEVHSGAGPENLLDGSFGGGVDLHQRREGDVLAVRLSAQDLNFPVSWGPGERTWSIALNNQVPLTVQLSGGANEATLDLTELIVTRVRVKSGASTTRLLLPRQAGLTQVEVDAGVATVEIRVPENVSARIQADGGLTSINVNQERFPRSGGVYESPDYSTAANRADIRIDTGVSSIRID